MLEVGPLHFHSVALAVLQCVLAVRDATQMRVSSLLTAMAPGRADLECLLARLGVVFLG